MEKDSRDCREEEYLSSESRELPKTGLKKGYCSSMNGEGRIAFGAQGFKERKPLLLES
jgi:hypothetical protein